MSPKFDVFLSHNNKDKVAVERLAQRLREADINPFLDKWHLIPGEPWQEALEEALDASSTVAIFIGPSGISPWHNEEMRAALKAEFPEMKGSELSKLLGERWNSLSEEEKAPYEEKYRQDKERYDKEKAE